ncbi:carboxypeptidase-like regulatory domain-containing protein [Polaribacter ponticola]|uniref:Carboxypeptidase-like regulatory domain-containing protein n=1 Tax=Polaribacter ponticola TaxID=2978475 RepID=A0ABT5SCS1_9FLAO|nr:carboxypeptidase-like regulatory domain-containing protein [Polaribacter sp. MSW5]MDD7915926.1 hypothetical protein [Polaribacter sp. MSW5]
MKKQLVNCLLLFISATYAQVEKTITGKVVFDNIAVSDVHIVNKNTNIGTITNKNGVFDISASLGDTLHFTHINLEEKLVAITKKIITKNSLEITLVEKTYALDEIVIGKPRSIFYVDPELMPPSTVNAATLKLPYVNTIPKQNTSIVKLRSGGVVSLDNLINSLNGNKKRIKELKKAKLEDSSLNKIRKHFTDDFFITDLKINKENINPFLNYCFKKNIVSYFNRNENIRLTKILIDESKKFPQKIKTDSVLISIK